jgi:hypothetical protein
VLASTKNQSNHNLIIRNLDKCIRQVDLLISKKSATTTTSKPSKTADSCQKDFSTTTEKCSKKFGETSKKYIKCVDKASGVNDKCLGKVAKNGV